MRLRVSKGAEELGAGRKVTSRVAQFWAVRNSGRAEGKCEMSLRAKRVRLAGMRLLRDFVEREDFDAANRLRRLNPATAVANPFATHVRAKYHARLA